MYVGYAPKKYFLSYRFRQMALVLDIDLKRNIIIFTVVCIIAVSAYFLLSRPSDSLPDYACGHTAFDQADKNIDNALDENEFLSLGYAVDLLAQADINGDSELSKGEFFIALEERILPPPNCQ